MKLQQFATNPAAASMKYELHYRTYSHNSQGISKLKKCEKILLAALLDRRWALFNPNTKVHQISLSEMQEQHQGGTHLRFSFSNNTQPYFNDNMMEKKGNKPSFYIVRDDLLHPFVNGNKARKLDGLLPLIEDYSVTDVVTCGGCQSAHAAAVAVSCAERGLRSHLLLRGEQPDVPTGYNLISTMYGNVTYIPRSQYAKREEMLRRHADLVASSWGSVVRFTDMLNPSSAIRFSETGNHSRKVVIINEGAADVVALLGVIRLVEYLSQPHLFGKERPLKIIVDAGTGTTAIGLQLGAICFGLPWEVIAVMLADTIEGYKKHEKGLISDFKTCYALHLDNHALHGVDGDIVHWVERRHPRKFGNVLKGEVEACQQIAQQTGILVDPVYTLAAWEQATLFCQKKVGEDANVMMLHTGGTLGMFGLAQRYKSYFHTPKDLMHIANDI